VHTEEVACLLTKLCVVWNNVLRVAVNVDYIVLY
jgi:hypothetical protein